jgi:hypothetical protein
LNSIKVQLGDFIEREGDLPPHCVQLLVYRCWSVIVGLPVLIAVTFFRFIFPGKENRTNEHCTAHTLIVCAAIDRSLVFSFEQERDETQISTAQWDRRDGTFGAIMVRYGSSTLDFFFLFFPVFFGKE